MADSDPAQEGRIEGESAHQSERFMTAIERVVQVFHRWGEQHGALSANAQTYDFVASQPQLAVNLPGARENLRQAIDSSEAPEEIVSVYRELYPELFDQGQPTDP